MQNIYIIHIIHKHFLHLTNLAAEKQLNKNNMKKAFIYLQNSHQSNRLEVQLLILKRHLGFALFTVLESVCQSMQCHVSIMLLAIVSHKSNPHHHANGWPQSSSHFHLVVFH